MFRQVRDRFRRSSGIRFKAGIAHQLETAPDLETRVGAVCRARYVPVECRHVRRWCVESRLPKEVC